jgi:hypothetical protein
MSEKLSKAMSAMERTEASAESLAELSSLRAQLAAETKRADEATKDLADFDEMLEGMKAGFSERLAAAEARANAMAEVVANHWTDIPPSSDGWWLFHESGDPRTECRMLIIGGMVATDDEWEQHAGAKPGDDANYWEGNRVEDLTIGPLTKGLWKRSALLSAGEEAKDAPL